MDEKLDLLVACLPSQQSNADFANWFSSRGQSALSQAAGSNDVAAFRTTKGPQGFNILLRTKVDPLDDGLIPTVRQIVEPCCGSNAAERPGIGLFRFASSFAGTSAGEEVKAVLLIGRAAGTNSLEEFRAWYDEDHISGMVTVPGVVRATRFEAPHDPSYSLVAYEVSDPQVQSGTAWPRAGNTAWTRRIRTRYIRWFDVTSEPMEELPVGQAPA